MMRNRVPAGLRAEAKAVLAKWRAHGDNCTEFYCDWTCTAIDEADDQAYMLLAKIAGEDGS